MTVYPETARSLCARFDSSPCVDRGQEIVVIGCDLYNGSMTGGTVDREAKQNGRGWCENVSPTLNAQDKHAVVFTIDADSSNSMKSANPNSGIHETDRTKCLDTGCLNPQCNQGGVLVCYAVDCRNGELNREKSATLQAKVKEDGA